MNEWLQSDEQWRADTATKEQRPGRRQFPAVDPNQLLLPRLGRNLRAGFRLALLRKVAVSDFRTDLSQIVALFVVNALVACLVGYLVTEPPRGFNSYGLMGYATHQLVFIANVLLVAAWLNLRDRRSALFVILLSGSLAVQAALLPLSVFPMRTHLFEFAAWAGAGIVAAAAVWTLYIAGRAMKLVSGQPAFRLVLPLAGYALILYGVTFVIPHSQMWYSPNWNAGASENLTPEFVDAESTYYAQPRLMRESFNQLDPGRPGLVDVYFVGFANYAHQDVFRKEVELVRSIMEEQFDTGGRSMTLINNAATVDRVPLANRPNLSSALKVIGGRMNADEDVLFLFLTSHGSKDGVLAAKFWPLSPNDLSADNLKEILDESGIRWRILVVSACYSGTFIDALKDDDTLILTASRKDRNSFGCSNDRELTYFGEHFFAQELASGKPLIEAFEAARVSLAVREKKEGFTPSEPQMYLGAGMQAKLAELETRLVRR